MYVCMYVCMYWFPSNSCHHSNCNGQPLILNNVEYLEN